MVNYGVYDVFTPSTPASLTFVERESINERLVDGLRTPGKQLVIYGYTGSGKTTIIINKLKQLYEGHIITKCMSGMTFDQLVYDAFDQLDPFYSAEKTSIRKSNISSSISAQYISIRAIIKATSADEVEDKQQRLIPPQLTSQRLASFMGAAKLC